ncbi:MAG TPA: trigger factor [Candidatus Margulisiibacteriota bacterium]|nr:trigger factor [Candidatus Margulisiibacteriota bacterium]
MKTEVKKLEGSKRELSIEVSGEVVKNKFEDVFKKITQEAKVPGFRPGHAPRDIVEKNFSSHAHEQVLKELIPEIYNQAIGNEGLDVIELPEISDVKLDRSSLSFKAKVEVSPEIALKEYKHLKVNYKPVSVTPEEIKRSVDSLKEARKMENADDNLARSLGYPKLGELEKAMERHLLIQKDNEIRQKIENSLIESLTKELDFKVPQSLIKRQAQDLLRQAKVDLALKGIAREKIEENAEALSKEIEPEAEKQVRVYLVLSEIAKKENMPLDDQMPRRVMEFLLKEADWQESD